MTLPKSAVALLPVLVELVTEQELDVVLVEVVEDEVV
jgi:hypothetical protein